MNDVMDDQEFGRRTVPDFSQWESPETRIRWERGLALIAGVIGVVFTFFFLYASIPLSPGKDEPAVAGVATAAAPAGSGAQAQPPAAAAAGLQATPAATPTPATGAELKLSATSRATPNVRRGPGIDQPIVMQLRPQQRVDAVGRSVDNQWLQILNPDNPTQRLWVSADMLDVTGDTRTLPEVRP